MGLSDADDRADPRSAVASRFRFTVVTLFPSYFQGPLGTSLLGKAIARGDVSVDSINPRDFAHDRHRTVDDTPYGGGPGMVLKPEPLVAAIEAARAANPDAPAVMLTPQGRPLTAELVESLAALEGLVLVCGRYEGVDERVRHFVDDEISIGDYVLSGGETAALVVIEAVSRHVTGVLGNRESLDAESFTSGTLEYPQYTRPVEFRGMEVPEVLLSGDHGRVAAWRRAMALLRTKERRPDLFAGLTLSPEDRGLLETLSPGLEGARETPRPSSGPEAASAMGRAEGDGCDETAAADEARDATEPDKTVAS